MPHQCFVQIISGPQAGKKYILDADLTVGRQPDNRIVFTGIDAASVSGYHATFSNSEGTTVVFDNKSTNGIYVNGKRVTRAVLVLNDIVSLGKNGPRIKISGGPGELSQSSSDARAVPHHFESMPTRPDGSSNFPTGQPLYPGTNGNAGNYTQELSKRLVEGDVNHDEMSDLIKNRDRISRMDKAGVVDSKDLHMLKSASAMYTKSQKKTFIIVSVISGVALVIVLILGVQNLNYRSTLKKQQELVTSIQMLNQQFIGGESPEPVDSQEKFRLLARLRSQERQLATLRQQIAPKDLASLYQDSLGIDIHKAMESFGESNYIVPDIFIREVKKQIQIWQTHSRLIRKTFANKNKHASLILRELREANLPTAFLYLAMHESALDSAVISHAGARGLWQFMPGTGRDYGLKVPKNWRHLAPETDERTHPLKSTRSAIKYLKVLLGQFGTVPLAMAAYNAGEGRISRELRKIDDPINNRDFWYIFRSGALARETNMYVPKIVATMVIDQNRGKYGF
ncbi:MAG: transglycosylase SLT domain-containing protein [Fibrobacteria bacterium]|nr:transglycosylase SLT domain-containing protein [Fibrobacteria bacterium]